MAMSADQRATLQLLLERGKSYGDLAQLLGQPESEVRARARAALTELGGADPDRNVGLTDYLLGQADPIGRADASRHLRDDPADYELAAGLSDRLREEFPAAELPRLPGQPRPAGGGLLRRTPPPSAAAPGAKFERRRSGLSVSQTRLIVICTSAAVILIAVVLAITGAFGGSDEGEATAGEASTSTTASQTDEQIQRVALRPVSGGNATGTAIFGLATGDQPYVDVSVRGLDPAPEKRTYVIWLMLTGDKGYPLSPLAVSEDGSFQDRYSIPAAVLPIVARVRYVDVSIAPVAAIRKLVNQAIKSTALVIDEPGEVVLRGRIPKATAQQAGSG
jgi:hypothetical protein